MRPGDDRGSGLSSGPRADSGTVSRTGLRTLTGEHGVQLRQFSEDIWREVGRISEAVVADTANADPLSRRVYESYREARRLGRDWANVSEAPYYQNRELVLGR